MEYEEYMVSLTEQIHDKRAKQLVAQEIENHIVEQAEVYEAEGMGRDTAIREAVRQMGNPVETGAILNQIHKPKMPWLMLGMVTILMLSSIFMQAVVCVAGADSKWNFNWESLLPQTIVYNMLGFSIILLLLHMDYNFIAKSAYKLYTGYMIGLLLYVLSSGIRGMAFGQNMTMYYGVQMLFPIIFAGIIYRNRNRGWRGIAICLVLGMAEVLWYGNLFAGMVSGTYYSTYPAMAESILMMGLTLAFAIWRGIFGRDRKQQTVFFSITVLVLIVMGALLLMTSSGLGEYIWKRVMNIFTNTDSAYMNHLLQDAIAGADWIGGASFVGGTPELTYYTSYLLNCVFTYYGKLAGIVVIAFYVLFLGMALTMSLKQSNRIGFLIGTACTVSILVRFVAYLAINMGCALWWTTLVPFFSYGKVSAVMNGIYIGLILCVYRNSSILKEDSVTQKRLPRIRVTIE